MPAAWRSPSPPANTTTASAERGGSVAGQTNNRRVNTSSSKAATSSQRHAERRSGRQIATMCIFSRRGTYEPLSALTIYYGLSYIRGRIRARLGKVMRRWRAPALHPFHG
jgi:hypothetical protein